MECSPADLLVENFGKLSRAHPRSIWGTICTWSMRYVPFIFGGTRETSTRLCEAFLVSYAKEFFKGAASMEKAVVAHEKVVSKAPCPVSRNTDAGPGSL
jgi:hypothetical protein